MNLRCLPRLASQGSAPRNTLALALALGLPAAASAQVGGVVYSADTADPLVILGDVDGDGVPDFAMDGAVHSGRDARRLYGIPAMPRSGSVQADFDADGHDDIVTTAGIISGRSGAVLSHLPGAEVAAGDVDGDGFPELVRFALSAVDAHLEILSGRTGQLILRRQMPTIWEASVIGCVGDITGDGVLDLAVFLMGGGFPPGRWTEVLDGATGDPLWQGREFGRVSLLADIDGDGVRDLAVQFPGGVRHPSGAVLSGRTGSPIPFGHPGATLRQVEPLGDVDGDGAPDCAVIAAERILFVTGDSGHLLAVQPALRGDFYHLRSLGDVDGDGVFDFAVEERAQDLFVWRFWHSRTPSLTTADILADVTAPVSRPLRLEAGAARAGQAFLFLGSVTGTDVGFSALGASIPLNFDAYTALGLQYPQGVLVRPGAGVLDARGRAEASLAIPPGISVLRGLTMHHAAVTFAGANIDFVSNTVPLIFR